MEVSPQSIPTSRCPAACSRKRSPKFAGEGSRRICRRWWLRTQCFMETTRTSSRPQEMRTPEIAVQESRQVLFPLPFRVFMFC